MSLMDNTDFYFISNSNVLKNHIIFHYAFKKFYRKYKKGRFNGVTVEYPAILTALLKTVATRYAVRGMKLIQSVKLS